MLLFRGWFSDQKPLSQIQRSTLSRYQQTSNSHPFGGFGLRSSRSCGWTVSSAGWPAPAGEIDKARSRGRLDQVQHKTRRLGTLRSRLSKLEADVAAGTVRLCFGSKRLWHRKHELRANGYASHEEWTLDE